MLIREARIHQLRLPLEKPYRVSFRTYTEFEPIVVELVGDDSQVGWGEAYIPPGSTFETTESAWAFCDEYGRKICGSTVAEAQTLLAKQRAHAPFACCAMSTALAMLDRHCALVTASDHCVPLLTPVSAETKTGIVEEIETKLDAGYKTFKVKVGWDVAHDLEKVKCVQEAVHGRALITIDANRAYTAEQGIRFASSLAPEGIALFEQPCEADQWDANARVARASTVPLMLDESIRTEADIDRAAQMEGVQFVKLKLKRVGGVEPAISAMKRAKSNNLDICLGDGVATEILCWMEACVSRDYLTRAGDMNGFLKPKVRLLANPLPFERGSLLLKRGYWPEVDRDVLRAHQVREQRISA
jgi:L-alanine-DL-glutamate epimerase-like enolase superfamily enzyme